MSEHAPICSSGRIEVRTSRYVDDYKVSYGCWLPEGHAGPHWALVSERSDTSREPRSWTGDDFAPTSSDSRTP